MKMDSPFTPLQANTILYCDNWAATARFYGETLGLRVHFANDWFVEFALTEGSFLSVADARRATITAVAGQGITLAWRVADAAAARAALLDAGADCTPLQRKWGGLLFYTRDPEGHRLELWEAETG